MKTGGNNIWLSLPKYQEFFSFLPKDQGRIKKLKQIFTIKIKSRKSRKWNKKNFFINNGIIHLTLPKLFSVQLYSQITFFQKWRDKTTYLTTFAYLFYMFYIIFLLKWGIQPFIYLQHLKNRLNWSTTFSIKRFPI